MVALKGLLEAEAGHIVLAVILGSLGVAASTFVVSDAYLGRETSAVVALQRALSLLGRLVVVTAGPTYEPLDEVRRLKSFLGLTSADGAWRVVIVGTLVSGIVKRVDRNGVYVDLGSNAEGFVPRDQMIPREPVRSQDRIKAYLQDVRSEQRGPQQIRGLHEVSLGVVAGGRRATLHLRGNVRA